MDSGKYSRPDSKSPRAGQRHVCTCRSRSLLCADQEDTVVAPVMVCSRSNDRGCCRRKRDEPGRMGVDEVPQRVSSMSRSRGTRELTKGVGALIGSKSHISSRRATKAYLPMIQFIHDHDPEKYRQIAEWLDAKEPLDEILSLEAEPAA